MNDSNTAYEFSYDIEVGRHEFWETPDHAGPSVPLDIFKHTSTIQALARYLVDVQGLSFTQAARILHRSPKSIWTSYHQTDELPAVDEETLRIPVRIFTGRLAPLEALVAYLRDKSLRNIDIAKALDVSPKTTHTAWKRAEVKR